MKTKYILLILGIAIMISGGVLILYGKDGDNQNNTPETKASTFDGYWYKGKAEITSYELEQARYGEIRKGTSVLIFVTEPFLAKTQVKADYPDKAEEPVVTVLKLNMTKKFQTGIYPYSLMSSVFSPVKTDEYPHALKTSVSSQEWCGHMYEQLNNKENHFEYTSHSYFMGEADQNYQVEKNWLEDELWNYIRIAPEKLPLDSFKMIPGGFYSRLMHKKIEAVNVFADLKNLEDGLREYYLSFPAFDRTLSIVFEGSFPHKIVKWKESYTSGFGDKATRLTTTATKKEELFIDYWNKNAVKDSIYTEQLGL